MEESQNIPSWEKPSRTTESNPTLHHPTPTPLSAESQRSLSSGRPAVPTALRGKAFLSPRHGSVPRLRAPPPSADAEQDRASTDGKEVSLLRQKPHLCAELLSEGTLLSRGALGPQPCA